MKVRNKTLNIIIAISFLANLLLVWQVWAGPVDSPAPPNGTNSYTLEDLYNRLDSGADGSQSSFTEPGAGPGTGTMHTLNEIMAVAPAQDPANSALAGQVLAGRTYWGLGTGARWGTFVGTRPFTPLPRTGQTTSYEPGDDGDLEQGEAWPNPRFSVNGDGTVTDNLTGLIWLQNADCFGGASWSQALSNANNLAAGNCGLTDGSTAGDWRLPNLRELYSLNDFSQIGPALPADHPFTNVSNNDYWTSTTWASVDHAWTISMVYANVEPYSKAQSLMTWPVRDGS